MSECTSGELRDLLPELVNDQLDAATRSRVEAHVGSCAECAAELELLRALRPALVATPAIDTKRIAAAVRARTAPGASRAPARTTIATRWTIAIAAAALIAVSAIGYFAGVRRSPVAESVANAPRLPAPAADSPHTTAGQAAPESARAPRVVAPRSTQVRVPSQQVAVAPPQATPAPRAPVAIASTGMLDNVSDLSDDQVRALTASLDKLSAVPDADPAPGVDPLGAALDDAAGGRK